MPAVSKLGLTTNALVNGLLSGSKWTSPNLTFSFPSSAFQYASSISEATTFQSVSVQIASTARSVLAGYAAVSGLTFTELTTNQGDATLRLGMSKSAEPTAYAYLPNNASNGSGGDVWFGIAGNKYATPVVGNYAWFTQLHELGHALGLKHGQEISGIFPALPAAYDAMEYSVMTYRSFQGSSLTGYTNEAYGFAQTLMIADIAAIQSMYGANYTTNGSDSVYSFNPATGQMSINGVAQAMPGANRVFLTIWDGGGNDTYDLSNYSSNETINLNAGSTSLVSAAQLARLGGNQYAHGNIYNALMFNGDTRSLIENANGGFGNDSITGNQLTNILHGNAGNDLEYGLEGDDRLYGEVGNDSLYGGNGNDQIYGGAGTDTLYGGAGADRFVFLNTSESVASATLRDVVADFDTVDLIDLSVIDANLSQGGDQAFTLIGKVNFAVQAAGQVRFVVSGLDTLIQIENTGDGIADMEIRLVGYRTAINAQDFIL